MASVLSFRPQSPFKRSFSDNPYASTCSPLRESSLNSLKQLGPRNASACSLYSIVSLGPIKLGEYFIGNENAPLLTSRSLLDVSREKEWNKSSSRSLDRVPLKRTGALNRKRPSFSRVEILVEPRSKKRKEIMLPVDIKSTTLEADSAGDFMDVDQQEEEAIELYDLYDAIHVPLPEGHSADNSSSEPIATRKSQSSAPDAVVSSTLPKFRRWMSTLRRRHAYHRKDIVSEMPRWSIDASELSHQTSKPPLQTPGVGRNRSSSMSSSLNCVMAVNSASITIASASIAPRSDASGFHPSVRLGTRDSNFSEAGKSVEGTGVTLGPIIDEGTWLRSLQRRKIVEEIISSEESYIGDLKVLINDYFMILTSVPTLSTHTRASIQHNIHQILQLHQDLLTDLQHAIPDADFTQSVQQETYPVTKAKHVRFHSADLMPGRFAEYKVTRGLRHSLDIGRSPDHRPRTLATDAKTAGNIAKVFNKHMKRFFAYEEYGAHWTTMSQDLATTCKGFQGWFEYERGVEALSKLVASENNKDSTSKKALTFSDLLIKPIQRVCKYPLLFDDLCRHTPVYDDPEAHAELEKALFRLQETIREVNKAKDDPRTRRLIEISWLLQDRLAFKEQTLSRALVFRLLGHVLVSGVLHVTYQTPDRVKGQYMLCVLYKSCLVLATTNRLFNPYNVVATIALANGNIEEPDNGRGLQCHTAPFTWKLMFEYGHRLHEIILSACSSQEEESWKVQLRKRIVSETHDFVEGQSTMQDMFSSLSLDIKSLGPVFGHADSLVRRMSVHRAATLGSKTHLTQVIIKNTQAQKSPEPPPSFAPNLVTRSQSHMSTNHVPTLAPRRAERIRLETALEDVWTKDILPFPGMGNRRVENHIRASANSVMRKLSMASIASNFSRRSPSFSSLSNTRSDESFGSRVSGNLRTRSAADRRPAPAVVDFHNAPAAFLPTDFEIKDTRPSSRRRRLGNRATGTDGSIEKSTPSKPKRTRRLSAQIINLSRTDINHKLDVRAASSASNTTIIRSSGPTVDDSKLVTNEKQHTVERREARSQRPSSCGTAHSKKFTKSKSNIFKFWV